MLKSKDISNDIRRSFTSFFKKNSHVEIASSPLIPDDDPSLLFTNSGMVQFKNFFTVKIKPNDENIVTIQKCIRAGSKHNDLENVEYTPRHHTFFEMLGNFSFGGYFKETAIELAWNLITKDFGLDKDRLYVTVFHEDDEAFNFWKKIAGFSDDKIIRIATSDNFWSMGETGPCGPCSEIFYDHGDHLYGGLPGTKEEDGDRFIEIWNLVFMQFEQVSKDKRINLPKPSVDTGMGLERIAALLQGTHDNYETDHFKKLINSTSEAVKVKPNENNLSSFRVIADHLRASSFLIAEGVLPSNEGRGYVLRRIMRRGMRHSHLLGSKEPIFYNIFKTLMDEMKGNYPEIERAESLIRETLKMEEEKFLVLLDRGIKILNEEISKIDKVLPGEVAFKLYDTYGFPLDLTQDILKSKSLTIDNDKFNTLMQESRELAKKNWKGSGDSAVDDIWFGIREKLGATEFLGYETNQAEGVVLSLLKDNKEVDQINSGDEAMIIINQTPFYGESGGQVGDKGEIISGEFIFEVEDVQKKLGDLFVHYGKVKKGSIKNNENVEMKIDIERRDNVRAYHSATHLLHESLRRVLGTHVTQKGSLVEPDRLRFDFSHMKPISSEEIEKIETYVNSMVSNESEVKTRIMTPKEAVNNGALALFGEKYGDEVRVVSIGKSIDNDREAWSVELCGGTHVKNTSEISTFKILSETGVSSGVRRIEALTNMAAINYYNNEIDKIRYISSSLKTNSTQVTKKIEQLVSENQKINKELKLLKNKSHLNYDNNSTKEKINGIVFEYKIYDDLVVKELKPNAENFIKNNNSNIVCLISKIDNKASIVVAVDKSLTSKFSAVEMVNEVSAILGGKGGGGRPDMAQSGGSDPKNSLQAINKIKDYIKLKI